MNRYSFRFFIPGDQKVVVIEAPSMAIALDMAADMIPVDTYTVEVTTIPTC